MCNSFDIISKGKKSLTPLVFGLLFSPFAEIDDEVAALLLLSSPTSIRVGGKLKAGPLEAGTFGEEGFDPYPITALDGCVPILRSIC